MTAYRGNRFSWRAFVSLYVTWSSLILLVSGIILYIAPAGRIAKWAHIYIIGLEKAQWQALHTIFSFLFIIAGGFHLYYNWKPFISYLKDKFRQGMALRKELYSSTLVILAIFTLTLWNVPPFSSVMELGEYFTGLWESNEIEPPVPHAEAMTIEELAKAIQIPAEQLVSRLKAQGITADKTMVVKELAGKYGMAPIELYQKMQIQSPQPSKTSNVGSMAGRGYGRKKLADICKDLNIPLADALKRLKAKGIETDGQIILKDLSNKYDMLPVDVVTIIQGQNTDNDH